MFQKKMKCLNLAGPTDTNLDLYTDWIYPEDLPYWKNIEHDDNLAKQLNVTTKNERPKKYKTFNENKFLFLKMIEKSAFAITLTDQELADTSNNWSKNSKQLSVPTIKKYIKELKKEGHIKSIVTKKHFKNNWQNTRKLVAITNLPINSPPHSNSPNGKNPNSTYEGFGE